MATLSRSTFDDRIPDLAEGPSIAVVKVAQSVNSIQQSALDNAFIVVMIH